jgi:ligand-binding SRPBCC domain-containing protein
VSARYRLERTQRIPAPRSEVFAFFADAANLQRLTPDFLRFRILTPGPIAMHPGTLVDYQLTLYGIPIRWRTRIDAFNPEMSFVDTQLSGPYRRWVHQHTFHDIAGGTEMRDVVDYEIPFGPLGVVAHRLFVRSSLDRIFDYRHDTVAAIFGVYAGGGSEATSPASPSSPANPTISPSHQRRA